MEIGPVNKVTVTPVVNGPAASQEDPRMGRQIVTAIQGLNKSELMGEQHSLAFKRDPETHRPVIQILNRETGEVIDQIPPEVVLEIKAELDRESKAKGEQ